MQIGNSFLVLWNIFCYLKMRGRIEQSQGKNIINMELTTVASHVSQFQVSQNLNFWKIMHWSIQVHTCMPLLLIYWSWKQPVGITCCWVQAPQCQIVALRPAKEITSIPFPQRAWICQLPLVGCVWIHRGTETWCGLRQGLTSLFPALIWGCMEDCSSWKHTSLLLVTLCLLSSDPYSMKW